VSTRAVARRGAPATARARTAPAPRPAPPRPRPRPAARPAARRRRSRSRVRLGRLVIPIVALLLAGIVWVNVAKLTLTNETGRVIQQARSIEAETARLKNQLAQRNARVIDQAGRRLGMELAPTEEVTWLRAGSAAP
jgi:hypothetical protein